MPLFAGKENFVKNIKEMVKSKTFASDKDKKKRQQMAVAAAYAKLREKK